MWYVYLLLCRDKSIYTGITNDMKQRLRQHKSGRGSNYTRSHKAVRILYSERYKTRSEALKRESQIKKLRRGTKLNLVKFGKPNLKLP